MRGRLHFLPETICNYIKPTTKIYAKVLPSVNAIDRPAIEKTPPALVSRRPAEINSTILSQCSTLFVMRLSNDRDQELIRSAVSDATANLLSFIPSLGVREAFTFGAGVALPTCVRFQELSIAQRPNSETAGNTRSDAGTSIIHDMIASVIGRWRNASMSYRLSETDAAEYDAPPDPPPLQPAAPTSPLQSPSRTELLRASSTILKNPLGADTTAGAHDTTHRPIR